MSRREWPVNVPYFEPSRWTWLITGLGAVVSGVFVVRAAMSGRTLDWLVAGAFVVAAASDVVRRTTAQRAGTGISFRDDAVVVALDGQPTGLHPHEVRPVHPGGYLELVTVDGTFPITAVRRMGHPDRADSPFGRLVAVAQDWVADHPVVASPPSKTTANEQTARTDD